MASYAKQYPEARRPVALLEANSKPVERVMRPGAICAVKVCVMS